MMSTAQLLRLLSLLATISIGQGAAFQALLFTADPNQNCLPDVVVEDPSSGSITINRVCTGGSTALVNIVGQDCPLLGDCTATASIQSTNYPSAFIIDSVYDARCQSLITGGNTYAISCPSFKASVTMSTPVCSGTSCTASISVTAQNVIVPIRFGPPSPLTLSVDPTCTDTIAASAGASDGQIDTKIQRTCADGSSANIEYQTVCPGPGCIVSLSATTSNYNDLFLQNFYQPGCQTSLDGLSGNFKTSCPKGGAGGTINKSCSGTGSGTTTCQYIVSISTIGLPFTMGKPTVLTLPMDTHCLDSITVNADGIGSTISRTCGQSQSASVALESSCGSGDAGVQCSQKIQASTTGYKLYLMDLFDGAGGRTVETSSGDSRISISNIDRGTATGNLQESCNDDSCQYDGVFGTQNLALRFGSPNKLIIPTDDFNQCTDTYQNVGSEYDMSLTLVRKCTADASQISINLLQKCSLNSGPLQCTHNLQYQADTYKLRVNNLYENGCNSQTKTPQVGSSSFDINCSGTTGQITLVETCQGVTCKSQYTGNTNDLQVHMSPGRGAILPLDSPCADTYQSAGGQTNIGRSCNPSSTLTLNLVNHCSNVNKCLATIKADSQSYDLFATNAYQSNCRSSIASSTQGSFLQSLTCGPFSASVTGVRQCHADSCMYEWDVDSTGVLIRLESPKSLIFPLDSTQDCQDDIIATAAASNQVHIQRTCKAGGLATFDATITCGDEHCSGEVATSTHGYPVTVGDNYANGCVAKGIETITANNDVIHTDFTCPSGSGTVDRSGSCNGADCSATSKFSSISNKTPVIPSNSASAQIVVPFDNNCVDSVGFEVAADSGQFVATNDITRNCSSTGTVEIYHVENRCALFDCRSTALTQLTTSTNSKIGILNLFDGCANTVRATNSSVTDIDIECLNVNQFGAGVAQATVSQNCNSNPGNVKCQTDFSIISHNLSPRLGLVDPSVATPTTSVLPSITTTTTDSGSSVTVPTSSITSSPVSSSVTSSSSITSKTSTSTVNPTPTFVPAHTKYINFYKDNSIVADSDIGVADLIHANYDIDRVLPSCGATVNTPNTQVYANYKFNNGPVTTIKLVDNNPRPILRNQDIFIQPLNAPGDLAFWFSCTVNNNTTKYDSNNGNNYHFQVNGAELYFDPSYKTTVTGTLKAGEPVWINYNIARMAKICPTDNTLKIQAFWQFNKGSVSQNTFYNASIQTPVVIPGSTTVSGTLAIWFYCKTNSTSGYDSSYGSNWNFQVNAVMQSAVNILESATPRSSVNTSAPSKSQQRSTMNFSHWDRLPYETKDQIFASTDILTRYLNDQFSEAEIELYGREIWMYAIKTNWCESGDLARLPKNGLPTIMNGLLEFATTKDLYHRLSTARPDLDGIKGLQTFFTKGLSKWTEFNNEEKLDAMIESLPGQLENLLINIPLRHNWIDELAELSNLNKIKLFLAVGFAGHKDYFQNLYKELSSAKDTNGFPIYPMISMCTLVLRIAISRGHLDIVKFLLEEEDSTYVIAASGKNLAFQLACEHGRLEIVQYLLDQKERFGINPGDEENTAFITAAANNHIEIAKLLWSDDDVDVKDRDYEAVTYAAEKGYLDMVKWLMVACDLDYLENYNPVLVHAATHGNLENVKLSIEAGADPSANDNEAFMKAAENGHASVLEYLISLNPLDAESYIAAIESASVKGHADVVRLLIGMEGLNFNDDDNTAICNACEYGFLEIVKLLLGVEGVEVDAKNQTPIRIASAKGHLELVKFLVGLEGVNPAARDNEPIWKASANGQVEVVKFLLGLEGVDPTANDNESVQDAAMNGHIAVVQLLLGLPGVDVTIDDNEGFRTAAKNEHWDMVKLLMEVEGVDVSSGNNECIRYAAAKGQLDIVKALIGRKGVDATADNNYAIRQASINGHSEVVKFLLGVEGVDATAEKNEAIREACSKGHIEIVKMLLATNGVDVTAVDNTAFRSACVFGRIEVVKLLLEVPGVDPTANTNEAFRKACRHNHVEIVKLLLASGRVDATAKSNDAICQAVAKGNLKIIEMLLQVDGVDATVNDNWCIRAAANNGHFDATRILLGVNGVDATAQDNYAIRKAALRGFADVVRLLLCVKGVDPSVNDNEALKDARRLYFDEVVKLLTLFASEI
ncbi:hypothetical protein HDU76_013046 [Blyttiomyces sp. JEL0837]|nr:hypothetical protein HDU76_013046 [Blyttiomyces sp. JEL0837]